MKIMMMLHVLRTVFKPHFFSIFKQVGHFQEVEILPGVKRQMKTLSMRPLVFGKMEKQEVT